MTLHADALLGRDFTFYRADRCGLVRSRVTITAFDPARGWKLASGMHGDAWVPTAMLQRLFADRVLVAA